MTLLKDLSRLACRLQRTFRARSGHTTHAAGPGLDRLEGRYRACQLLRQALSKAIDHGLTLILPRLHADLHAGIRALHETLAEVCQGMNQPVPAVPSVRELVDELRQLEEEFDTLTIDWKDKYVGVTTEPITLEDVVLGPFAIQLYWQRLSQQAGAHCFDVVALEPNPAADHDHVTHPHVSRRHLCAGAAALSLQRALANGRLADAFQLVHAVLRQYNQSSPHVRLDDWGGTGCADCGRHVPDGDSYYCAGCEQDFCEGCSTSCADCGDTRCSGCLEPCACCQQACCYRCRQASAHSGRRCCSRCRAVCTGCRAEVAKDEITADTGRCQACQGVPQSNPGCAGAPPAPSMPSEEPHAIPV
jgi:hypothetical protein